MKCANNTRNFLFLVNSVRRIYRRNFPLSNEEIALWQNPVLTKWWNAFVTCRPQPPISAVVSVDGLIMASALQQGVEEDRVSAMSAAMLSLGERISGELGRGGLEQVYIKGDKGAIVLTSIGDEAVLTAMARQDAKLGMIFLEMRRAAEDLTKLVG
jgi:predicted regulator of Ras-like GTPase activity (Roadblock/LC7/MglB family)